MCLRSCPRYSITCSLLIESSCTLKYISPDRSTPPIAESFLPLTLHLILGVFPFGAHVLGIRGVSETPASSTSTSVPLVSLSFFLYLEARSEPSSSPSLHPSPSPRSRPSATRGPTSRVSSRRGRDGNR